VDKRDAGDSLFGYGPSDFDDILITKRITDDFLRNQGLKKIWTPKYLWALGTGTVLAGMYNQWSLHAEAVEPLSVLAAVGIIAFLYVIFIILVSELAVHFPYAGGPYAFARRGLGTFGGYLAGTAGAMQFIFGTAALFVMFKSFILVFFPGGTGMALSVATVIALLALCAFNSGASAGVQFFFTNCALSGLILFFIGSSGAGHNFSLEYHPVSFWSGVLTALPVVIWYFFGLEGLSLVAEETKNPERTLPLGLILSVVSVSLFCFGMWFFVSRSMPEIFFSSGRYPLLFVLEKVQGQDRVLLTTFSAVSLCAYVVGLNGFINGFSRQVYSLARGGYYPLMLGRLHANRRTPDLAILFPGMLSILIAYLLPFKLMVCFSIVSALFVHILVLISYFQIRKYEPALFRFGGFIHHPFIFFLALFLVFVLLTIVIFTYAAEIWKLIVVWGLVCLYYFLWARHHIRDEAPEESRAVSVERKIKIDLH